ncbi:MAG: DUF4190 domain-containing protein [Propionibacteriaceae bacterium]|nr:DUF4190 domain-containing protein [Propionibacteriaceae bacterium]
MTYEPPGVYENWPPNIQVPKPNGVGTGALVLGIIACVLSWIPFINVFAVILGIVAVILAIIGLALKGLKRQTAIAGLILGVVSLVIANISLIALNNWSDRKNEEWRERADITDLVLDGNWVIDTDESKTRVLGVITNTSDKPYRDSLWVNYKVLDLNGDHIGYCSDSTWSIPAHGTWEFSALCQVYEDGYSIEFVEFG